MGSQPYMFADPQRIALAYEGDKQRIAQAMQLKIINPTAGTLAGMLIDQKEAQNAQVPQQTIAQQIFAPPAPPAPPMGGPPMGGPPAPAGLGSTPEAAQMPPMPGMGGPPPGAPPMGGPPPGAPPMGMAEGGMVPPYMAGGGLYDLPIPDDMFDEPSNGGYANGGIVAFAAGDVVGLQKPDSIYGYSSDPMALVEEQRKLYKPKTEAADRQREYYEGVMSEEGQKKRLDQDRNAFFVNFGGELASTAGPLVSAVGKSLKATAPGLQEATKERRAEQRDAIKQLALDEGASNAEARREADLYMQGKGKYAELKSASETERRREGLTREEIASRERISGNQIAAEKFIAGIRQPNESDFDAMFRIMTTGTPAQKAGLKDVLKLKQEFAPAAIMDPFQAALLARMPGGRGTGGTTTPTKVEWK